MVTTTEAEFKSIVGRFVCEVHWGDCDPAGIIFYPTYFRWFDASISLGGGGITISSGMSIACIFFSFSR